MTGSSKLTDKKDIAVSTRVRLARNLKEYPFATKLDAKRAKDMISAVRDALEKSPALNAKLKYIAMDGLDDLIIQSFVERHLISPEFANSRSERALLLSDDEHISIMLNEEDHIRLQVMGDGFCPDKCLKEAVMLDMLLDETLTIAFDEELGYLTHCPTNLGTGLRASVMMHLPMLTRFGEISRMVADTGKIGIAVRGVYGEGSKAKSDLYQISNQLTLGFSEDEIIERLTGITDQITARERALRKAAMTDARDTFEDRIFRSAAILRSARLLSAGEAENLISDLRLGVACNLISGIDFDEISRILYEIGPAGISLKNGSSLPPNDRDRQRAAYMRETLSSRLKAI
ncbi:MAG: protein arginine kinase [Bacillota bacterium]|nr:protein arginine kinase [Bacillota bacterium]